MLLFAVPSGLLLINSMCYACERNTIGLQLKEINFILFILVIRGRNTPPTIPTANKIQYKIIISFFFISEYEISNMHYTDEADIFLEQT